MNRLKKKLSLQARKKNDKEVRKPIKLSSIEKREEDLLTRQELAKQRLHKAPSPQKKGMLKLKTPATPKKHGKKTSKRTSSGNIDETPAHIQTEGGNFWRRVLTKQGALQRKLFGKSSLKRK